MKHIILISSVFWIHSILIGEERPNQIILKSEIDTDNGTIREWLVPKEYSATEVSQLDKVVKVAKAKAGDMKYSYVSGSNLDPLNYDRILDSVRDTTHWQFVKLVARLVDEGRVQSKRGAWVPSMTDWWFFEVYFTNGDTEIGLVVIDDLTVVRATESELEDSENPVTAPHGTR